MFSAALSLALAMFTSAYVEAAGASIAVGEITPPPASSGIDASALRDVAAAEIGRIDPSRLPVRRKVVVSLALTRVAAGKTLSCTVNMVVRDADTGVMIAIIEAGAQAEGQASAELRKRVAHAAVRRAVRRIPRALGGE